MPRSREVKVGTVLTHVDPMLGRSKAAIVFWVSSGVAPDGRKAERQRVYDMVCGKEIERLDNRISVQRRFKLA